MSVEKIISSWRKKEFKPVYLLHGEEDFFIDQIVEFAEKNILSESDASFNLSVFYGKDAEWTDIINVCKSYPMVSDMQVVILKEAQQMKDFAQLESYVLKPLKSTLFIIAHKTKPVDKRTKLGQLLVTKSENFLSTKIDDEKLHDWIIKIVKSKALLITPKAAILLEEHIGNDLSRISNEVEKLSLNVKGKDKIDEDDIEKYIGISKEYNVFELLDAITKKDLSKSLTIINYFESNPKASPIQAALPAMYPFFSKAYAAFGLKDISSESLKSVVFYKQIQQTKDAIKNYGKDGIERIILLMNDYNLKSLGVGSSGVSGPELLKEMVIKIILG
ncbi:MAG: DNA polymerase III subunit delta [Ferruginibacter sp.]